MKVSKTIGRLLGAVLCIGVALALHPAGVSAANKLPSDFSLQVSPSPLVTTLKPGQTTTLELKIHNGGTGTERLKIAARGFTTDNTSGTITLDDTAPSDVGSWVSFGNPTFAIAPGQWFTEKITIAVPAQAGFSYSFALLISRQETPVAGQGQTLNGSVAVFTLMNIDRPGAIRQLEIANTTVTQSTYEYLPATVNVTLKNTGNTIVQPQGNVYFQRGNDDAQPISALSINNLRGYILPGTTRNLTVTWDKGFPAYKTTTDASGQSKQDLVWDWSKLADFRIGSYTAKVVAVYNDGQRDVPLTSTVTFWVIPWRLIIGTIVLIAFLWYLQHLHVKRKTAKAVKKALASHKDKKESPNHETAD